MTLTENLDLRQQMLNAVNCFEEAIEQLCSDDVESAIRLWTSGQKQANFCKILLVKQHHKEATM